MNAVVLSAEAGSNGLRAVNVANVAKPSRQSGNVIVRLLAAALNRRDHWIRAGMYPGVQSGAVLGADGCGIVVRAPPSHEHLLNTRVVLNPGLGWGPDLRKPAASYRVLGMSPLPGTLAEFITLPAHAVLPAPAHLTSAQAAALPLAGLTAWRALFSKGELEPGQVVVVTGIGGGVAWTAMQLAVAAGARVVATSSSQSKLDEAIAAGCVAGALYTADDVTAALQAAVDRAAGHKRARAALVIDGAGGDAINSYIRILDVGGRIVSYGVTGGLPRRLDLPRLFLKTASILGTSMGSPAEFGALLRFVNKHRIVPRVDWEGRGLCQATVDQAFDRLARGVHIGKVVLQISNEGDDESAASLASKL